MNTHMNIWITEQVVIVIHLHALCRACKVFCLEPVVLLSMGFLTERLKWGRGEWEHRCYWVALLLRKNDLCLQMPPLSVFGASCYAPVPSFLGGYHAGIKTCHLPRWWTAGVPPTLPMSVKCCPPECVWDAALAHMPKWKYEQSRTTGICTAQDNRGRDIRSIWFCCSWFLLKEQEGIWRINSTS